MRKTEVHGTVADGFGEVREEFTAFVAEENGEPGAQLAVFHHGRQVVDLWAGADVTGETLTGLHSSTKGATYLVVALLVQDGVLDLDQAVARHWPEFAVAGKAGITLRDVLTHRTGVIGAEDGFTVEELADDRVIAARVAGQRPLWRPGSAYGYGGFVTGALLGEVVRRITGSTIQELFEARIREPYGLDLFLGLPAEHEPRYLPIQPWLATPEQRAEFEAYSPAPHSIAGISYNLGPAFTPADVMAFPNARVVRAKGQSSGGGVGSARGLAALYAAAVSEVDGRAPMLKPDTAGEFAMLHSVGTDLVGGPVSYALGFQAKGQSYPFLSTHAFGHNGSAGSEGFADPRTGIAYGYTRRRAAFAFNAPENERLAAAVTRAATALS
ncbi:serine hydrolase domain-containing protein [Amycolatopsis anabasis]|uniref:serine hydrolase domain-containing protein n=1 Tax=Amycolatopsis anabasis TaxID=1840409 RepID=UPI00131ADF27|nr:serine hydrolase domain-containing protein [Amycolatopsis anabasis]